MLSGAQRSGLERAPFVGLWAAWPGRAAHNVVAGRESRLRLRDDAARCHFGIRTLNLKVDARRGIGPAKHHVATK
jgi:hypothetical protein